MQKQRTEYDSPVVIVLDEKEEDEVQTSDWRNLRGRYSGKLSSVENFILAKQEENFLRITTDTNEDFSCYPKTDPPTPGNLSGKIF